MSLPPSLPELRWFRALLLTSGAVVIASVCAAVLASQWLGGRAQEEMLQRRIDAHARGCHYQRSDDPLIDWANLSGSEDYDCLSQVRLESVKSDRAERKRNAKRLLLRALLVSTGGPLSFALVFYALRWIVTGRVRPLWLLP